MSRGLDIRKAEAALTRAARKAVHGTREDRSGRVLSSALTDVKYHDRTKLLEIRFVTGRTYQYLNVPKDVHERLMRAESKGLFFNTQIRDHYDYREITDRVRR
jgi:KTSC domain